MNGGLFKSSYNGLYITLNPIVYKRRKLLKIMKTGLKVAEAMTKRPVIVSPDIVLLDCAKLMLKRSVGSVIVKDKGKVLGILTEKDILRKVVAKNLDTKTIPVSKVMTKKLVTISPNEDIYDAMYLMSRDDVRRLPVIKDNELIGILTHNDILKIQPDLFEIFSEKILLREEENKPIGRNYLEGPCANCGTYSQLFKHRKKFVCEACKIR